MRAKFGSTRSTLMSQPSPPALYPKRREIPTAATTTTTSVSRLAVRRSLRLVPQLQLGPKAVHIDGVSVLANQPVALGEQA